FSFGGKVGEGFVSGESLQVARYYEVSNPDDAPFTLTSKSVLELEAAASNCVETLSLSDVKLLPPIPPGAKLICLGYNYKAHIDETNSKMGEPPAFFARWPDTVMGHESDILLPPESETFDFEGEIAVIIGTGGRRIALEDAHAHIFGYTCFMDGSIREYQKHSPTAGKNFFQSGGLGPWVVTKDEAGDPAAFEMKTFVGGEMMQETTGELMVRNCEEIIAYVSKFTELRPGDMLATGTPGGVGAMRKPPRWMKAGEVVEVSISPIGALRNKIVEEA
ncbi:MAG: fumarylacetoacetate hydrolase family protein, partial [Pseudomonadota bacterium]